jgi:hypothetical protein
MEFYIVIMLPTKIFKKFAKKYFTFQFIVFVKTFEYKMLFPFVMDSMKFYICLLACQYFKFVLLFKPLYTSGTRDLRTPVATPLQPPRTRSGSD